MKAQIRQKELDKLFKEFNLALESDSEEESIETQAEDNFIMDELVSIKKSIVELRRGLRRSSYRDIGRVESMISRLNRMQEIAEGLEERISKLGCI